MLNLLNFYKQAINVAGICRSGKIIIFSMIYGWIGAIIAGLIIAVFAVAFDMPQQMMLTLSSSTGFIAGILGMSLPWLKRAIIK